LGVPGPEGPQVESIEAGLRKGPQRKLDREHSLLIYPRIDSLLDHVDSHYAAVIVAAKRARQINNYYHTLGEGVFEEFPPPMVDTPSKNYLTIALEEVAQGKINSRYRV
jgi:DNA-directed RNA polymerase subunit omega